MAISLVQSKGASGVSGSTATVSGLTATTAGNLLVLLVSAAKNPGQVTFTPSGAGWVQAGTTLHNDVFISISTALYYLPNCPAGTTSVSVTLSSAPSAWHIYVLEFSGVATTAPLDGTAAREQDHTTTPSSGAITTTAAGDLLVGWSEVDDNNGVYTLTQPAGWTALSQLDDLNGWTSTFPAWRVAGAAGSENYQPSKSNSQTDGNFTLAAFLAATGGGGGTTVNGSGTLIANSALVETTAQLTTSSAPVPANAVLTAQPAQITNTAAPVPANSALTAAAAQIVAASTPAQANSALTAPTAQIVNPSAAIQANAALVATGHIETPPPQLIANSALVQTSAHLVSHTAPMQATATLAQTTAQIVVTAVTFVAESVLHLSGAPLPTPVVVSLTAAANVVTAQSLTAAAGASPTASTLTLTAGSTPTAASITVG